MLFAVLGDSLAFVELLGFTMYFAHLALARFFFFFFVYSAVCTNGPAYWPSSQTKYSCRFLFFFLLLVILFIVTLLPLHIGPVIYVLCICMQWVNFTSVYL